ncbi:hypothetical protein ASO20_02030 [Mycoplasma sp. (ex Biomphalaria glabrata)]|nr:hypothetical protein ASO20_02030 [Mycoplasma sp. (ex Biomphalaria glabrata)]
MVFFRAHNIFDKKFLKSILPFLIPAILQALIDVLINFIDSFLIGSVNTPNHTDNVSALVGVTATQSLIFVGISVIIGAAYGCSTYAAQFFGAEKYRDLQKNNIVRLYLSVVTGLIFMIICFIFQSTLLNLFLNVDGTVGSNDNVGPIALTYAKTYAQYAFWTLPLIGVSYTLIASYRDCKYVLPPFCSSLFVLIIKFAITLPICLSNRDNPDLIINVLGISRLVSYFIIPIFLIIYGYWKKYEFLPRFFIFKDNELVKKVLIKALPLIVNELLWTVAISSQIYSYSKLGGNRLAGAEVSFSINELFFTFSLGLAPIVAALVGHRLGENDLKNAKRDAYRLIIFSGFVSIIIEVLILISAFIVPRYLYSGLTTDAISYARNMLLVLAGFYIFMVINGVIYYILRIGGDIKSVFIVDSISTILINGLGTFLLVEFLSPYIDYDPTIIYLIICASYIIKTTICFYIFQKKRWLRSLV